MKAKHLSKSKRSARKVSGVLKQAGASRVRRVLAALDVRGAVTTHMPDGLSPHYGTVIFIAQCRLETRYGACSAYVFQDLIHKGYILALAFGPITRAREIVTRIHSSCVTSETLRSCDCDCSKQLEGAIERIASHEAGILFYLIQEGRGVGYVAKARDRMVVQASHDELSTFDAYAAMGLRKDYRNYEGIASICHVLGLRAPLVVLTNNPDKVNALRELGLRVKRTEALEFEPAAFNLAYLRSKQQSGHILKRPLVSNVRRAIPPRDVHPFLPRALEAAGRFLYVAEYYLPMKPVDGEIVVARKKFNPLMTSKSFTSLTRGRSPLILAYDYLDDERVRISIHRKNLGRYRDEHPNDPLIELLTTPYWFQLHAYYDVVSGQDFLVLIHGEPARGIVPILRIHSESIFDRFPLKDVSNRDKLKASAKAIVNNGYGMIVLLYNDGRGAGLGAHAIDRMRQERGVSRSSDETYQQLGVAYDTRDYDAALTLACHHLKQREVQMIMNSPDSLVRKREYSLALHALGVRVKRWIFLENEW